MPMQLPNAPQYLQPLLDALREPRRCLGWSPPDWDRLIRMARKARLLGVLAARLDQAAPPEQFEAAVRRHLIAGQVEATFRRQKTLYLLSALAPHFTTSGTPCVLLKGAAYVAQGLAMADGRMPADVDAMVPRAALDAVERSLVEAGWQFDKTDPYDQRYYRDWSHELPPLRSPGQALELDLHHTILPPLGRLKPDTPALFAAAVRIDGSPFSVLCPADQTLLAAAHLFQDSDCTDRLRDLVDIDGLLRAFASGSGYWTQLVEHARRHQLGRPLWYATVFARAWLATPIPADTIAAIDAFRPPRVGAALLRAFVVRTLPPIDPDAEATWVDRWSTRLLEARAAWLRMPPSLVAHHAAHKVAQAIRPGRGAAAEPG